MMRRKRMVLKRRGRARAARTATMRGRKRRKVTRSSQWLLIRICSDLFSFELLDPDKIAL
jgi:hypothetical protein